MVQLTYFNEAGYYYDNSEYETNEKFLPEIYDELKEMFRQSKRLGLTNGHDNLHVLINIAGYTEDPLLMLNVA